MLIATFTVTTAEVGVNVAKELLGENSGTIIKAQAYAKTAPTGADLIFDINVNGTSIWNATQANRIRIVDGANEATPVTSFDTTSLAAGDNITLDVDQVGSTAPGAEITVQLEVQEDAVYFGDPNTDGSKRITTSGSNVVVQERVSGTWETVHTFPNIN
jgi:hypothetical protein